MKKIHVTHKIITTSIVGTLVIGSSAAAVYAYQSMAQYKPSSSKQNMKNNQVLFNNKDSLTNSNQEKNNSKWLEKQDEENKKNATQNSNYLFDKNQNVAVQKTMTISNTTTSSTNTEHASNSKNENSASTSNSNTVVDIDKNAKDADIIINDQKGTSGKSEGSKDTESVDVPKENPGKKDDNDDNHHSEIDPGKNPSEEKPSGGKIDYGKIKDPASTNRENNKNFLDRIGMKPSDYSSEKVNDTKKDEKYKMHILIQPSIENENMLYQGATITKQNLYDMLVTGVMFTYGNSADGTRDFDKDVFYSWDESAINKYIKINGISVDDGKTWIKDFPYTIGENVLNIKLDISYRLSENDKWTSYNPENPLLDTLGVSETKVVVLKKQLDENTNSFELSDVANSTSQFLALGSTLNLLQYTNEVLGQSEYLDSLLPGWTENGKAVDWAYTVDKGRHFIEPMDLVKLDASKYLAKVIERFETVSGQEMLCGLQTLVGTKDNSNTLVVPKYIQMLDFDEEQTFDSVELPDTVMVVHDDHIHVKDKWIVSKDNENLAVKDGILMSKDLSRIISVPDRIDKITITKKIKSLDVGQLTGKTIYLTADDIDDLPEIPYKKLKDCKIVLKDAVLDAYLRDHYSSIVKGSNVTFARQSDEDTIYTVKDHCIMTGKTLYKAIKGVTSIHLNEGVENIEKNAFKDAKGIHSIILSDKIQSLILKPGCFDQSGIKHIYCSNEEQQERIESQLKKLGYTDIQVHLMVTEVDGFKYKVEDDGTVTLLKANPAVVEFNGYVGNVLVDQIGGEAFKDCASLKSVYLPENIKVIGEEAFENCSSLEIMLIDSKDTITIGNNAFEGLSSARMIASNARGATLLDGYELNVYNDFYQNCFFIPCINYGYGNGAMYFQGDFGNYTLENIGSTSKAIYLNTTDGTPFLMMASNQQVDSQVTLPSTTSEFYPYAMANTYSASEGYTINLQDLESVYYNNGAFYNSEISGDIVIGENSYLDGYAFETCQYIHSVKILNNCDVAAWAFSDCGMLEKVELENISSVASYAFASWMGSSLEEIIISGQVPEFKLAEKGFSFSFTGFYDDQIKLKLININMTSEQFLYKYRYAFAGYTDSAEVSASQYMWEDVKDSFISWDNPNYEPTYDEIYDAFKAKLLEAENILRTMLGLATVKDPTNMPTDIPTKEEYEKENGSKEPDEEKTSEDMDSEDESKDDSSSDENGLDAEDNQNADLDSNEDLNQSINGNADEPESSSDELSESTEDSVEINEEDFQ